MLCGGALKTKSKLVPADSAEVNPRENNNNINNQNRLPNTKINHAQAEEFIKNTNIT